VGGLYGATLRATGHVDGRPGEREQHHQAGAHERHDERGFDRQPEPGEIERERRLPQAVRAVDVIERGPHSLGIENTHASAQHVLLGKIPRNADPGLQTAAIRVELGSVFFLYFFCLVESKSFNCLSLKLFLSEFSLSVIISIKRVLVILCGAYIKEKWIRIIIISD